MVLRIFELMYPSKIRKTKMGNNNKALSVLVSGFSEKSGV